MTLLPNEQLITSSNGDKVVLTNQRILLNDKTWVAAYSIEIFLEDISSVETKYKSNTVFLVLGSLALLSSIYAFQYSYSDSNIVVLVFSVLFFILWWLSRKHLISICSHGGKSLNFEVQQMSSEQIESFITKLQAAKLRRVNGLYHHAAAG